MVNKRKFLPALLVLAFGLALYSTASISQVEAMKKPVEIDEPSATNEKITTVRIVGLYDVPFTPNVVNISPSTSVIFLNVDGSNGGRVHTITSTKIGTIEPDGKFDSGLLMVGDSFKISFDEPGIYEYFDSLNPTLRGVINVK